MKNFNSNEFLLSFPDLILPYSRSYDVRFCSQIVADRVLTDFVNRPNFNSRCQNDRLIDAVHHSRYHVYTCGDCSLIVAAWYGYYVLIFV